MKEIEAIVGCTEAPRYVIGEAPVIKLEVITTEELVEPDCDRIRSASLERSGQRVVTPRGCRRKSGHENTAND